MALHPAQMKLKNSSIFLESLKVSRTYK